MLAFNIDDITQWFSETWQKLYISIPTILAFISAFGGTIIYKFAQLITNAKSFYATAKVLVSSWKRTNKQIVLVRKNQVKFQQEVCKILRQMTKACLPNKRESISKSIDALENLIESEDVIDADLEEDVEEVTNKKTIKIKVKKTPEVVNNNG